MKTHPETGRKSIFLDSHSFGVPGLSLSESEELLDGLKTSFARSVANGEKVLWNKGFLGFAYELIGRTLQGS